VNLFEIDSGYCSHPDYPLEYHLSHAAASFDDPVHKEAAWFHDLGKLTNEFQTYIQSSGKGKSTTHTLESALIFLESKGYELTPEIFAVFYAILKHHGNLEDTGAYFYNYLGDPDDVEDHHPGIEKQLETICQRLGRPNLPDIKTICDLFDEDEFIEENSLNGLHVYFHIKEIFSRLIFSDKYEAVFKKPYGENKKQHWETYEQRLIELISSKTNKMSEIRNQAREEILATYSSNTDKRIFLIEAPTGIGKTFSALHLALKICRDKNKKRLITALPMTSIIDQTHEEYSKITGTSELLKFHHLTYAKDYSISPEKDKINETHYFSSQEKDFLAMSWSEDKIIVTTFNQLFNLFYSHKNRDLVKFWTIRDSVIIVDEIQAVPRILLMDVAETMSFLAIQFDIDFILMSATLPEITRFLPGQMVASLLDNRYFSLDFNNRYALRMAPEINDYSSLVDAVKAEYEKNKSLLCVVNSKKLSLELFSELKEEAEQKKQTDELFFLNTNFIPKHRAEIINQIKERLKLKQKTLLVSTQVVEAGVDLDFDFGIREFAPLYSMIQTAGRVNRENRERMNLTARLIITDTIDGYYCPYHPNDLLKEDVETLLENEIFENKLLPLLKEYFGIAIKRTPKDHLLRQDMEYLNFKKVSKSFSDHFMKAIPSITQVFIEVKKGLYENFHMEIDKILQLMETPGLSLEKKMEYRSHLKNELKSISQYTINVSEKETDELQAFHPLVPIKLCPFNMVENESKYSLSKGWLGKETLTLNF
jgi:CRISPR-associated endonuclease/helicase Cas3